MSQAEQLNESPDVTEDLQALLREFEERYERMVESSPDVIFRIRVHPEVAIEYINPAGERILGYPLSQLREADKDFLFAILADDDERADAAEIIAGRKFYQNRLRQWRRSDGEAIWTEQHNIPIYDESGRLVAMEGVARDVTERERALRALADSENRQRRLVEALPDLMMRMDEAGTFVEHIPTASKQPAKVFLSKNIHEVVHAEALSQARQTLKRALAGRPDSFRCQVDIYGDERSYEIRFVPTGTGELLVLLRDITGEVWEAGEEARRLSRERLEVAVERQIGIRNPYQLTFREFTVLHLVARGSGDKEIANELGIAISTANKHVSNILGKMNASSRTEAGVRAVQEGLVSIQ